jgi:hypothetical protein
MIPILVTPADVEEARRLVTMCNVAVMKGYVGLSPTLVQSTIAQFLAERRVAREYFEKIDDANTALECRTWARTALRRLGG